MWNTVISCKGFKIKKAALDGPLLFFDDQIPCLGNRDLLIEINVLDRIEQLDAFCHRALEGFAA